MADKLAAPTRHFVDVVCDGNTIVADCEFCGRVHFASHDSGAGWDVGELEGLREKAKAQPEKYIENQNADTIAFGRIDGKQAVWNCPCHRLRRYEDFIWAHRRTILTYLKLRTAANLEAARQDAEMVADSEGLP